jgi:hypothetical protein
MRGFRQPQGRHVEGIRGVFLAGDDPVAANLTHDEIDQMFCAKRA